MVYRMYLYSRRSNKGGRGGRLGDTYLGGSGLVGSRVLAAE